MNENTMLISPEHLRSSSVDELKSELAKSLEITARHLRYLAQIWRELEHRGEDMSNLRHGLMAYLPMIADERVDPRLIVNYAGQKTLLSLVSQLPKNIQSEIAETGYVTLVKNSEQGPVEVQTQLSKLTVPEIHRVFDMDTRSIRTAEQQATVLTTTAKAIKKLPHVTRIVSFEKRNGEDLLVISGKRILVKTVISAMINEYPDIENQLSSILKALQQKQHQ